MPGSQDVNSLDLAYFLYRWRWVFRIILTGLILMGWSQSQWKKRGIPIIPVVVLIGVIYMTNFYLAADHMFYQPVDFQISDVQHNKVDSSRLVLGVEYNGVAKAYPIRFIGYHHQVLDTLGGKSILITYCTVCRTGRVYEPIINGHPETFRLVGMDHYNAMLEDETTKSWWRQVTGEAVTGPLKGHRLPEIPCTQSSLNDWMERYPGTLIMQADSTFTDSYGLDTVFSYENGKSRKELTGTDSISWNNKSWVVGVKMGDHRKAYDWNRLKKEKLIHDVIQNVPVLIAITKDSAGFVAFRRPSLDAQFTVKENLLSFQGHSFDFKGIGLDTTLRLTMIPAYQEFWHSWKFFNPGTER